MFNWYLFLAAALSVAAPLILIMTRRELQDVRSQIVLDLQNTFFKGQAGLPQIELVAARYRTTASAKAAEAAGIGQGFTAGKTRSENVQIWRGASAFIVICFLGFSMLLVPISWLFSGVPDFPRVAPALMWVASDGEASKSELIKAVAIAGFGFLGAYVFWVSYLIRATLNDELSALAFGRAALGALGSIIVVVVSYRAMGALDPDFFLSLGLAFLLGSFPNQGIARLAKWAGVEVKGISKTALEGVEVIPLQVIDGIDNEASVRLQESNLHDVQNLATANPIELYAETPFGLFETFDWVLQAQLCVIVGSTTFKALKVHNIRTIFDLERAVLAKGAPDDYVQAIGSVIFARASLAFRIKLGLPDAADPAAANKVTVATVRHAVAIIGDDMHVHRLRALWNAMLQTTSAGTRQWLYETGPLPGETADPHASLSPTARNALLLVLRLTEAYKAESQGGNPDQATLKTLRDEILLTVKQAKAHDANALDHLRLYYSINFPRKEAEENGLEIFRGDADFDALLA